MRTSPSRLILILPALCGAACLAAGWYPRASNAKPVSSHAISEPEPPGPDGRELFTREWLPDDPRSHGGDGLGPMFNDSSCVACHNLGGTGGAGPKNKNVKISTPFASTPNGMPQPMGSSFVQHHFSTDPAYTTFLLTQQAGMMMHSGRSRAGAGITERNTTALFGVGRIDVIPDAIIEAAAVVKNPTYPEVVGRVARSKDGRVGRFGWKAQQSRLDEFVLTACAVELGLQVAVIDQPLLPFRPDYKSPGLDMSAEDCAALVSYVRDLPAPRRDRGSHSGQTAYLQAGERLFDSIGCAACHTPNLGSETGIYSDLLLHDMGPALSDSGSSYGLFRPDSQTAIGRGPKSTANAVGEGPLPLNPISKLEVIAMPAEWKTPPLWGVRDSAPYLHDGRAATLHDAIALHDGQAKRSKELFAALPAVDQQKVIAFLKSLIAPTPENTRVTTMK